MGATSKVPLDVVLSKIGLGYFQFQLSWICGLGFSAAAIEVVLMSFVLPELRRAPWALGEYQLSQIIMIMCSGSIIGQVVFGALADRHGRRNIFILTVVIVVVFGIASSFAPTPFMLAFLRFCVGFGYGGNIAVDFTLYSEFLPTQGRGKMLFALTFFWPVGQICTCLLAWWLIPWGGWRVFVAVCAIPSLITAFARPLIPESPRWLLAQGRGHDATEVCRRMATMNGKSNEEVGLGDQCEVCMGNETTSLESCSPPKADSSPLLAILSKPLWRTTVGLLVFGVALNYISYGVLTLMPSFLEMKGIPKQSVYKSMLCNSLAQIPGVFCAAVCAIHIGRVQVLQYSLLVVGLALGGFAYADKEVHVVISTMCASAFLEAAFAVYHVYMPEVFPTDVRAFATGFLGATGNVMSLCAPLMSAFFLQSKTPFRIIMTISSIGIFAAFSTWMLLHIETKDRDLSDVTPAGKD